MRNGRGGGATLYRCGPRDAVNAVHLVWIVDIWPIYPTAGVDDLVLDPMTDHVRQSPDGVVYSVYGLTL